MLSEISQAEKYKYHMVSLMCGIKKNKTAIDSQIQDKLLVTGAGRGWRAKVK